MVILIIWMLTKKIHLYNLVMDVLQYSSIYNYDYCYGETPEAI